MIRWIWLPSIALACAHAAPSAPISGSAAKIVAAAKRQAGEGAIYTTGYYQIGYPNGDLPRNQGVCTDVVIRSLRAAGYDLQKLVHEDMKKRFKTYPRREKRPDSNIDHRRCPNLVWFFKTYGSTLTNTVSRPTLKHWKPGDIVFWKLDNGLDHTGVVSDRVNGQGVPFVVHNISRCAEEDVLTTWKIVGHYRYPR